MPPIWFERISPVHRTASRLRVRYRCTPGAPSEPERIQRVLAGLDGVCSVQVNGLTRSLVLAFDPQQTGADALLRALAELPVLPVAAHADAGHGGELGAVLAAGGVLLASRNLPPTVQTPVAVVASVPLFGKAMDDLMSEGITSHVLEALAVAISIGRQDHSAANTTTFLLALGEYLEHSIEQRSDELLKRLLKPTNEEVWIERHGVEALVPAATLSRGDTVIAATGTVIPVDGTVLGGEALVNEATMTGEGVPVVRKRGDRVLSGTLVQEGRLRIYAEQVGHQAAAARIADFVEQSLTAKSRTQLEASRLADRLVPLVLGLAGATWLVSQDWQRVAAVLQADYSCALKLSTPVAFKAAMYEGGRSGMLIKGAGALERLAEADTFVFDKTGTLTSGTLEVTDSLAFLPGYGPEDILNMAASVEEHYFHPMALAVVEAARRLDHHHHFNHKEVEFIVAHGVASEIEGRRIVVGSRHFVEEDEQVPISRAQARQMDRLHHEGKTLLYIGFGGHLLGLLALRDSLRPNTAATLQRLRQLGVRRILMLTGDHAERAQALAADLGIDECHAGLLPQQKAEVLQRLAASGAKIAFVGDGVNDAPALTGSHVGISMHQGADIARLASDIALLEDDIARVADARALAQATRKLIASNFRLTVGLNTSILSAAAFGWLSPVSTSMLHNGSTIAILLRALAGVGLPRQRKRCGAHQSPGAAAPA
ncbi:MAG: heavy metal translocating P-type ATPase [Comamonadaceae bacterium]|nr:heavy metal translocating P-type ATPase [Comamonadaceae bacterium]